MTTKIKYLCVFIGIIQCFYSCVSHKDLVKVYSTGQKDTLVFPNPEISYKLQSGDILNIKVSSIDPQSVAIFNKTVGSQSTNQMNETGIYLNGYILNDSGNISLPLIGNLKVSDLTVQEAKAVVEKGIEPYFKYASIDIKLVGFRVTVLGEVNRQGTFYVYNTSSNILQALGDAGGITEVGNPRRVKVIRKKNNNLKMVYVDLTSEKMFSSEFYYLQPNDLIYVEPFRAKVFRTNATSAQVVLASLAFVVVVLNFLKK